jgi:hypothetical protein
LNLEEWYVELFKYATGWCGYTPDVALDTTICNLELALEGKFDFIRKTNPWRTQKDIDEENASKPETRDNIAKKMQAWAIQMQGKRPDRNRPREPKEGIILPPGMEMPVVPTLKSVSKKG